MAHVRWLHPRWGWCLAFGCGFPSPPLPPPGYPQVTLSGIEIYLERIKDLLDPAKDNLQASQRASARGARMGAAGLASGLCTMCKGKSTPCLVEWQGTHLKTRVLP